MATVIKTVFECTPLAGSFGINDYVPLVTEIVEVSFLAVTTTGLDAAIENAKNIEWDRIIKKECDALELVTLDGALNPWETLRREHQPVFDQLSQKIVKFERLYVIESRGVVSLYLYQTAP
jgi:hypothetical protein